MATLSKVRSIFHKDLFSSKVAIVTGGGTGIGKAITTELASLGCKVVIASRKLERLEIAAQEINEEISKQSTKDPSSDSTTGNHTSSARVHSYQCNIRNEEEVKGLIEHTVKAHGRLDYLVNNGGGQFISPVADIRAKGWHAVIETNLTGTFYCCKHAYHSWMANHGGSIVNIIANMWKGIPELAHTGAARAGVVNLMYSMALEWANCGIRINSVAPGMIYSDTAADNYGDANPFKQSMHTIPAKRFGIPEEISGAVCFLLSPAASYITGTTIRVDGGQSFYRSLFTVSDHDRFPPPLEEPALLSKIK